MRAVTILVDPVISIAISPTARGLKKLHGGGRRKWKVPLLGPRKL